MKTLTSILVTLLITPVMAKDLTCYTPRMARKVVIKANSVAISKPFMKEFGDRAVASTNSVRTKFTNLGYEKILFSNGEKHTIHIENLSDLNDVDDYLVVKNQKGHEVIYPLDCE